MAETWKELFDSNGPDLFHRHFEFQNFLLERRIFILERNIFIFDRLHLFQESLHLFLIAGALALGGLS